MNELEVSTSGTANEDFSAKLARYRESGVNKVKIGLTDIDGVIRGKYVSLDKFASVALKQGGFCDCVFGWDMDDQLYEGGSDADYTGWHTGFPDTGFKLIADSERWLVDEGCPFFVGQFVAPNGSAHPLCPRSRLESVLQQFAGDGLQVRSGFEYEFFVFEESPHTIREKNYRDLKSLTPGNFGYSVLRTAVESDLFAGLLDYAQQLNCDVEGLHCETGPGVWEAALASQLDLSAADRANLFKTFAKVYLQKNGLMGTFMAKWSMDYPGQSGHFHFSLQDSQGANAFYSEDADVHMSDQQRHAVGGLQNYLPELLVLLAPTINSYTRLVKGAWAPTASTWGVENRTAAIRVIPGSASSQRIECRVGGADANPYLAACAVLAAAAAGIAEGLEPTAPVTGNAYEISDTLPADLQFASNLREATAQFERSDLARRSFGDAFVDHFVMSRRWECSEYDRHLNSWQLERYFEVI